MFYLMIESNPGEPQETSHDTLLGAVQALCLGHVDIYAEGDGIASPHDAHSFDLTPSGSAGSYSAWIETDLTGRRVPVPRGLYPEGPTR